MLTFKAPRFLQRTARRLTSNVQLAAVRATNKAGRWGRTRVRRALSELLNVAQKRLRAREIRATRRRIHYEYRIYRREFPPSTMKGVRFRPYRGQGRNSANHVGTLRIKAYGKQQKFEQVLRIQGPRGPRYLLLRDDGRRPNRVMGTWIKSGYHAPAKIKKRVRDQFSREFARQYRLLSARR